MADPDIQNNVYLITGDDTAMIEAEAEALVTRLAGEDPDPFAFDVIREKDGESVPDVIRRLVRSVKSPPFLGQRKTVWLQNFSGFGAEGTSKSKTKEARAFHELAAAIREGLPEDIALIMDGPGVDLRRRLAQACKEQGELIVCKKPDLADRRNWERDMRALIEKRATEKGLRLSSELAQCLVDRIGTDTGLIEGELEKIICYIGGPDQPVTREDIERVCVDQGEEISWSLSDALGARNVTSALDIIDTLLRQSRDASQGARALLSQTARYYRDLLQIKVFMQVCSLRNPRAVYSHTDQMDKSEKAALARDGIECIQGHPYRCQMLAEQSGAYSGPELIEAIRQLRDASIKCMTSSVSERVALEDVIMRIAARPHRHRGPRRRR